MKISGVLVFGVLTCGAVGALAEDPQPARMPVVNEEVNGTMLHSINLPIPLPFPIQPTFASLDGLRSLMTPEGDGSTAFVRVNAPDGFLVTGRNPSSGRQLAAAATLVPAAIAAAIAMPAISREKSGAHANGACRANLDGIRGAKQAWAQSHGLEVGAPVSPSDLSALFPDGLPACPDGGAYTLGVAGEEPSCSLDGH